jgi:hypothetical protein
MELTIYNTQTGQMETLYVKITIRNTIWFNACTKAVDIIMLTDYNRGLLIRKGKEDAVWFDGMSRESIKYSLKTSKELLRSVVKARKKIQLAVIEPL